MSVSRDDVRSIAALARLSFSEEEESDLAEDLNRILEYVKDLDRVDTSGVEPMTHVLELANRTREDSSTSRISRDEALSNAPDTDGKHFRVPKVIE
ncbi:Asp-tRNA(Asn)/Glu-tRNA(Gln) amidotransferase GatCAB subunit C [Longibacter salinarum]|uniref:Aspartyl/glutamyl-tRNA(Asn/Gln) amidotransferase subunit C n=1 Tax=Longibacter salinarum TaxID=1850348 RepID=A0A2A8D368_9BACT|nr:Asp-tRNA(Asn)/Glu-tRNA(Gln) amidotransferase subunit GatC [Longibacter salinarum]PEN15321.1 Asp-tRNA(Asn)/Glu-tRNA(Gln) amidotransferase GatCAB subunit C [Longibacter salinarum]